VNLVKDVHSETTLPKLVNQQFFAQPVFFPVPVKFINHRCYVNVKEGTAYPFKFGDEILSIDHHSAAEIEKKLQELVVADGFTTTGKQRIVNRLFYKLYALAYAPVGQVVVTYRNAAHKQLTATVATLKKSDVDRVYSFRYPELNDSVAGRYYTADGVPVLKLNTFSLVQFSAGGIDYYRFLDSAFTDLQTRNAKSLVIDLRQNNGGDEQLLQDLLGYLLDKPWQPYRSAFVKTSSYDFLPYTDDWATNTADRIKIEFQKDSAGVYTRKSDWADFANVKPNRFGGKLIVLIGGLNVSAGSSFPSLLYQNKPETLFVGEETAGGFYGNNSSYYLIVTLPHTKIHFKIPLVQLRLNVAGMPIGHGLQPQIPVQETMQDLKEGNDPAMKKALQLAGRSN
jgi:C-terminal processing protease CtpA/Prc